MVKRKRETTTSSAKHATSLEAQMRSDMRSDAELVEAEAERRAKRKGRRHKKKEEEKPEEEAMGEAQLAKATALAREQRDEERRLEAEAILVNDDDAEEEEDVEEDENEYLLGDGEDLDESEAAQAALGGTSRLSATETRLVDSFMSGSSRRTLADVILAKIAEKERERDAAADEDDENPLPAKVVQLYSSMAPVLARYRSGKLPKAFKVIPSLVRWDEILWLTRPDEWSPHCVEASMRVFASNLDPGRARIFYNEVLLERCREDIRHNKKLNYHLYQALHRALFKPAAWFKGILLPLATAGDATLAEALIFGSVLAKQSVPAAHAAVVILKLAQTTAYLGPTSVFLIVLFNKKYSLPIRVVHAVCDYFARFTDDSTTLPVLWHQSLLIFTQRYRLDIDQDHSEKLKALLRRHSHADITPLVRRELASAAS